MERPSTSNIKRLADGEIHLRCRGGPREALDLPGENQKEENGHR